MNVATAAKPEYFKRPYSFFKEGLTSLAASICGRIYSFSAKKEFACRSSYNDFANKFNASKRQVIRTIKALIDGGYIAQELNEDGKSTEYRYIKPVNRNTVVYTPMFFYERDFDFVYKEDGVEFSIKRKLTRIEADVLSIICGHSLSKTGGFDGSLRGLAAQVGVSTPSAKRAVDALLDGALITRPTVAKGRLGSTRYIADTELLMQYVTVCYPKKKDETSATPPAPPQEPTSTPAPELTPAQKEAIKKYKIEQQQYIAGVNAKADRENFYARRQQRIARRLDINETKASKNPKFVEAASLLARLPIELAKAELHDPERLPALQQEKIRLKLMRAQALKEVGLTEEDLQPKYICLKCKDSGYLPDGRACDCYTPKNLPKN